jgi:hypothetical protein
VKTVPRLVFLAGLTLAAASQQAAADPAVDLPPEGQLPLDFRCIPDEVPDCPLNVFDQIIFNSAPKYLQFDSAPKYLQFDAIEDTNCGYTPDVTNPPFGDGVGVFSNCTEDASDIGSFDSQELLMDIREFDGEGNVVSTASVEGIYLFPMTSFGGDGCLPNDTGTVEVTFGDDTAEIFEYTSDTTSDGELGCEVQGEHAILVDFGGAKEVVSIRVAPTRGSHYASGLELPDVSPENCAGSGDNNNSCEIQIGDENLDGGDLRAIITDGELVGNVDVVGGPWRVLDPRAHCQTDASPGDTPTSLVFNDTEVYTYLVDGAIVTDTLPLVVSDDGSTTTYFEIQATSCGIPRGDFTLPPEERDEPGAEPYIDIVEIATDIVPEANVLGFESDGLDGTLYECDDVLLGDDAELETQPLLELNVRDDEIKILSGVPGIIDPVGRDITTGCGSKRGGFKQFSFAAWNLVHAIQTEMAAEISAEIVVLRQSIMRYATCVDPSFYYGSLRPWPVYINTYFGYGEMFADMGNVAAAEYYFGMSATLVDIFRSNLEAPGISDNFLRCFATGPELDMIIDSDDVTPGPGDLPLNAWGDLVTQLQHLSYAIRTYIDELSDP